jgi:hypothetical protein
LIDSRARDGFAVLALLEGRELAAPVERGAALLARVVGQDLAIGGTAARGFDGYEGRVAVDPDSEIVTAR